MYRDVSYQIAHRNREKWGSGRRLGVPNWNDSPAPEELASFEALPELHELLKEAQCFVPKGV